MHARRAEALFQSFLIKKITTTDSGDPCNVCVVWKPRNKKMHTWVTCLLTNTYQVLNTTLWVSFYKTISCAGKQN